MSIQKRIAIGGISTECSTYSPLFQTEDDFNKIEGDLLVELLNFPFESFNIHTHPLFFCKSLPGGPVEAKNFSYIKEKFLKQLKSNISNGAYLLWRMLYGKEDLTYLQKQNFYLFLYAHYRV